MSNNYVSYFNGINFVCYSYSFLQDAPLILVFLCDDKHTLTYSFNSLVSLRIFSMRSNLHLMVYLNRSNKKPGRVFQDRSWKKRTYSRGVLITKLIGKTMIKKIVVLND